MTHKSSTEPLGIHRPSINSDLNLSPKVYKPRKHLVLDIYQAYVKKLLRENPTYWTRYDKHTRNYWVFRTVKEGGQSRVDTVISYAEFRSIIEHYFNRAKDYIIMGSTLNMGSQIGYIAARRVERNFSKKIVNFYETAKQPKTPEGRPSKIIYWEDDDWIRIGWEKTTQIANIGVYKFTPTHDDMRGGGFRREFSDANKRNPLLKYKYRYFPYVMDIDAINKLRQFQDQA